MGRAQGKRKRDDNLHADVPGIFYRLSYVLEVIRGFHCLNTFNPICIAPFQPKTDNRPQHRSEGGERISQNHQVQRGAINFTRKISYSIPWIFMEIPY